MIREFTDKFVAAEAAVKERIRETPPGDYESIVRIVIETISNGEAEYGDREWPDPERIHSIDDGDYQGTLVFVIAATGYQPYTYWCTLVSYGSCSGCDTLQAIRCYSDEPLDDEQVQDYWTLALHVAQRLAPMGGDPA